MVLVRGGIEVALTVWRWGGCADRARLKVDRAGEARGRAGTAGGGRPSAPRGGGRYQRLRGRVTGRAAAPEGEGRRGRGGVRAEGREGGGGATPGDAGTDEWRRAGACQPNDASERNVELVDQAQRVKEPLTKSN